MRILALACAAAALAAPIWAAPISAAHAAPAAVPEGSTYVALGSSFAAGPGIGTIAADTPARCNQSADNYPRQVARARKLKLIDRSCSGATTVDVLRGGQFGLPAQLDALTPDTRLVTVTIGGNDVRYSVDLAIRSGCLRAQAAQPAAPPPCPAPPAGFDLDQAFATTEANMEAIAAEVRRRSPQARLVFVDYVEILPAGAPCPALSITAADAAELKARSDRLVRVTAAVAAKAGAELVKASDLTRGHDACAAQPWAMGYAPRSEWGPVGFHPQAPAANAIAQALSRLVGG